MAYGLNESAATMAWLEPKVSMFFAGSRPINMGKCWLVTEPDFKKYADALEKLFKYLYENAGLRRGWFSGELGGGKISFWAMHRLRQQGYDVELCLAIPCEKLPLTWIQSTKWYSYCNDTGHVMTRINEVLETVDNLYFLQNVAEYSLMMQEADKIIYVDELEKYRVGKQPTSEYHVGKLENRNKFMVDQANFGASLWDGVSTGTRKCLEYAHKSGKDVVAVDYKTLRTKIVKGGS